MHSFKLKRKPPTGFLTVISDTQGPFLATGILEASRRIPEVEYLSMCGFPLDLETAPPELKSDRVA